MSSEEYTPGSSGDSLEADAEARPLDESATAWLIGQGIRHLNSVGKEGELAYLRVVELLRQCTADTMETVTRLFHQASSGDAPFRWSLLYLLGDVGNESAADFLVRIALKQPPEAKPEEGCEGTRDAEMLVSTMAVHALKEIAGRYPEASEQLLKIVSERPVRPILIEAVKAADGLGLRDKIRDLLPKEEHSILDIRQARIEELLAEPEREDGKERGFTPPKTGLLYTAPQVPCCTREGE